MTPTAKFNALIASTTVFLMFWIVAYAVPALKAANVGSPLWVSLGALLASAGIYRVLSLGIRWLMERWEFARQLALGAHYMHGTWVGSFIGHGGQKRYMVEHFSQDIDSLVITGRSFTDAKVSHGYWTSESVMIDVRTGRLVFTYDFEVITRSAGQAGVHTSLFERASSRKAPTGLAGFAHDLNDPTRIPIRSIKVSDSLLPWDSALEIAIKTC